MNEQEGVTEGNAQDYEGLSREDLINRLEQSRQAQSGSDRKVKSLQAELEAKGREWQSRFDTLLGEKKEVETDLSSIESLRAERDKLLDRKERIWEKCEESGDDLRETLDILGVGSELDDLERLEKLQAKDARSRLDERQKFARSCGRTITHTPEPDDSQWSDRNFLLQQNEETLMSNRYRIPAEFGGLR